MTDEQPPPELEVNFSFPDGLKVTGEEPYHILYVGDLAGSAGKLASPLADGVADISADKFDDFLAAANPTISFTIANPVAPGSVMTEVSLNVSSIKAFDPLNLIEQIPQAKALHNIHAIIVDRLHGKTTDDQLNQAIASAIAENDQLAWIRNTVNWSPAAPAAPTAAVDDLLGQLDLGGDSEDASETPPPTSPLSKAVTAAAGGGAGLPTEQAGALRRALTELNKQISAWLTAVLHAPQVKPVEAAWRSLAFLVSRIDFRKNVRLAVLHAPTTDMLERFRDKLIDPVFDEGANAPQLIIVDRQYACSAADFDQLDEWAQHGASLPAVVIAGASSQFFGVKHAWQMTTLPSFANMLDQWKYAKWKTLRQQQYARSLGVVFGRGLLRAPHDKGDENDLAYKYKEPRAGEKDFLWATGTIAIAATVANSVANIGWPTAMAGFVNGRVEGFKTGLGGKNGDKQYGPTDTTLPQNKIEEMAFVGLNAIATLREHEDALVWNGLSVTQPVKMDNEALLEVSLPYQLFAGRLASLLFDLKPHLVGLATEKVGPTVAMHIRQWLTVEGQAAPEDSVNAQIQAAEGAPGAHDLAVTVLPPAQILPGGIPVVMGYRLT